MQALSPPNRIVLFEFDKRFGTLYGDQFSFYDVNHPLSIDKQNQGVFDFIIADPPYLVRTSEHDNFNFLFVVAIA